MSRRFVEVTPSASRLTNSLRDIGYNFTTAMADLVDNSISACADTVALDFVFRGPSSYIVLSDNGHGMTAAEVEEALRFGTRREYAPTDLGRFGLGLKTASLSHARRITVASRRAEIRRRISTRTLDLDHIHRVDRWHIYEPEPSETVETRALLLQAPGTVVLLQKLDRLFSGVDAESGWARRRFEKSAQETARYLGMVFHRFIEGSADGRRLTIVVNGVKVPAWNPFALDEEATQRKTTQRFTLEHGDQAHLVSVRPYVLPPRAEFSSPAAFDRMAGPERWNRQQGLYIYRGDRLVQSGGWAGIRALDEHTKLARLAVEYPPALDELFHINVSKMRVRLPTELRERIATVVHETCSAADTVYRRSGEGRSRSAASPSRRTGDLRTAGLALQTAAIRTGQVEAYDTLMAHVAESDPSLAFALGFDA